VQDRPAQGGEAGDRCALALAGDFEKKDIERGMWLVDPPPRARSLVSRPKYGCPQRSRP
jgi:selenocysteine-specific translation elongation factor